MPYLRPATDHPFGFVPYGPILRTGVYRKAATSPKIYEGDLVQVSIDGNVNLVAAATTSTTILGVAAMTVATNTAETRFTVYDDPSQRFYGQDDSDTTNVAETNIGNLGDIIATGGNDNTNRSQMELDSSSFAAAPAQTAATIKLVNLHEIETGFASASGNPRTWVFIINPGKHYYATQSGV